LLDPDLAKPPRFSSLPFFFAAPSFGDGAGERCSQEDGDLLLADLAV
jgi:hypothetical protein